MKQPSVGFVGGGRIAGILLEGWKRAGKMPTTVVVSDCKPESLTKLKSRLPEVRTGVDEQKLAAGQEVVFLAVHPQVMAEVAMGLRGSIGADSIVVSLAPKFTLAKLTELLGVSRVARVIPNAPSVVNFGFNPLAFSQAFTAGERAKVLALLEPLGECPEVAENKLEAYALLTAMGPTYLWFQLQALRELAVSFGLSEPESAAALKKMVCGSARTLLESGLAPAEVMDLVPVKPLAEMESAVLEAYRSKLPGLFQKIKP